MKKVSGKVPLERALSKRGLASRKEAQKLIAEGKIKISGRVITDPFFMVTPETMEVEIEGQAPSPIESTIPRFLMLHKPKGCVTTTKDEKNRTTVYDYLKELDTRVISVGRLDFATTGLLFFTNVNRLMDFLTDPQTKIERSYSVTVRGEVTSEIIQQLVSGIQDKEEKLQAKRIDLRKSSQKESHLLVTLTEGKNREIRRMFEHFKHEVTALKRVSYGNFDLDVEVGQWREVSFGELAKKIPQTKSMLEKLKLL